MRAINEAKQKKNLWNYQLQIKPNRNKNQTKNVSVIRRRVQNLFNNIPRFLAFWEFSSPFPYVLLSIAFYSCCFCLIWIRMYHGKTVKMKWKKNMNFRLCSCCVVNNQLSIWMWSSVRRIQFNWNDNSQLFDQLAKVVATHRSRVRRSLIGKPSTKMRQANILTFLFLLFQLNLILGSPIASSPDAFANVKTKSGEIRGSFETTFLQRRRFYSFKGIPYAKSPVNALRFKVSAHEKRWNN